MKIGIVGLGTSLPSRRVTNDELATTLDTSDEWIRTRTGIGARRIAADDVDVTDLATEAAQKALDDAGLTVEDIGLIIVGTATGRAFPSTACIVQERLGARGATAFDISAACSGFIFALQTAASMLSTVKGKHALVIGAEKMSSIVDWSDRSTAILFGDGAGAVVIGQTEQEGLNAFELGTDGRGAHLLFKDIDGPIEMNGREVFKFAVRKLPEIVEKVIQKADSTLEDVDILIPHQANLRIIDAACERLHIPQEKVIVTIDEHANTSAASIPLALEEARKQGRLTLGTKLVLAGFGAGLTWGAAYITWTKGENT
ncbi:beta-ketoacyl-ACP synthase III [Exiguobacterium sp. UBA3968]|uniref:beta-ketoacyl-ACP synthase III n=1 Tax=Exiguobacterium sp. UBA3968 TaxID=1946492 RepID=UPI0025C6AECA|nr:beta-ketoacyl-ACP synthase III [Exiguobacterium sp. UBA3968]